jgi:hypothetical protein
MIKHIALFKLKPFAEGADRDENIRRIAANVEVIRRNNPQARLVELGIAKEYRDPVSKFPSYDLSICAECETEEEYVAYLSSPAHLQGKEFAARVSESVTAITYEA